MKNKIMRALSEKKLSLIIPAYNKDSEVFQAVSDYLCQLKKLRCDWEIIVVDDASCDQTLREAVRSKKFNGNTSRIKIYSYNLNQGKGFALYFGFKKSQGDIVIFADSDLDLAAKNINLLLDHFISHQADIALGSKRHPLSQVRYPTTRKIMSKTYQFLTKALFNLNVSDTQVGLKAFRREVLEECFPRLVVKKFAFDVELLVVAKHLGFEAIVEVPIILKYNFSSTIHIQSVLKILQDTFAIYFRKNILNFYEKSGNRFQKEELALKPLKALV